MRIFSNQSITIAEINDIGVLTALLNTAYRGEESKKGWTTEANIIAGDIRTTEDSLKEIIKKPDSVLLKFTNDTGSIIGCVNLQKHNDKIYLGMLSVSPKLQNAGIGKELLQAAEEYAQHQLCSAIYMTVITTRTELINWYCRHGYMDTCERTPFIEDGESGKHLQKLEFMVLEKKLSPLL